MPSDRPFKIISVAGAHSSVGKTTLCSIMLNNFKGFGAIKFTKTAFYTSIIDDPDILLQKDKDTAVMFQSGAEKVVWIQGPGSELEDPLNIAISKMAGLNGVLIEGNSAADFLNPYLIIFVIGNDGDIKPSADRVSRMADVIVVNSEPQAVPPLFLTPMLQKGTKVFYIDLKKKKGEIDKFLTYVKQYIE